MQTSSSYSISSCYKPQYHLEYPETSNINFMFVGGNKQDDIEQAQSVCIEKDKKFKEIINKNKS